MEKTRENELEGSLHEWEIKINQKYINFYYM